MKLSYYAFLILLIAWFSGNGAKAQPETIFTEGFNSGLSGWTATGSISLLHQSSAGNPGGALWGNFPGGFIPMPTEGSFLANTSASGGAFTGNLGQYDSPTISFDFKYSNRAPNLVQLLVESNGDTYSFDSGVLTPGKGSWHTYNFPLVYDSNYHDSPAGLNAALADVDSIAIYILSQSGESFYLDNVALRAQATKILNLTGDLNFGNVSVGGTSPARNLNVNNVGNSTVTITNVVYPDGFSGPASGSVVAGSTLSLDVFFTPTAAKSYTGSIKIQSDATAGQSEIAVSGTSFESVVNIYLQPSPLEGGSVTGSGSVEAGSTNIIFALPATGWQFDAWNDGNTNNLRTIICGTNDLSFTAIFTRIPTRIIGLSGHLDFQSVVTGQTSILTMIITNRGNSDLSVSNIVYPQGFSGPWTGIIKTASATNVPVSFSPIETRSYTGQIQVISDATSGSNTIAVSGIGSQPFSKIVLSTEPSVGGFTTGGGTYVVGSSAQISAFPSMGWQFDQWSDDNTQNPRLIMIGTNNVNLVARFSITPTRVIGITGNLNFGAVKVGEAATSFMTITNRGNNLLTLNNIIYPEGFSGSWTSGAIAVAASSSTNITVNFAPLLATNYIGEIQVVSDATGGTSTLTVSGQGEMPHATIEVVAEPASGGLVSGSGSYAVGSTNLLSAYPNKDWMFHQWLEDSNTNNPRMIVISNTNNLTFTAAFELIPTRLIGISGQLHFGSVMVGETVTRNMTITNSGNSYLQVSNILYPDGFSGAWTGTIASASATNVLITFMPTNVAGYSGVIQVLSDATNNTNGNNEAVAAGFGISTGTPSVNITLAAEPENGGTLFGANEVPFGSTNVLFAKPNPGWRFVKWSDDETGATRVVEDVTNNISLTAYFELIPTRIINISGNLNYGPIAAGESVTNIMTIHNDGSEDLIITNIIYPAGFSGNQTTATILSNASIDVAVTFSPTNAVEYVGTIRVLSNATDGNNTIQVNGRGTAPLVTITVHAEPDVAGLVSSNQTLTLGSDYILYANAFDGWRFAGWSDNNNTNNPRIIKITETGDLTFTALFSKVYSTEIGLSGDLDFGPVEVGSSETRDLVITNTGNQALTITNIIYPEGFSGVWTGLLAVASATNLSVIFSPLIDGVYTGSIFVLSEAMQGTNTIHVSGEGVISTVVITTEASPPEGGIVTGGGTNLLGSTNTLTAIAESGWLFQNWSDGVTNNPRQDIVTATNLTYTAEFVVQTALIDLSGDLDFGAIAVGSSKTLEFTITNSGNSSLTITNIIYPEGYTGLWTGRLSAASSTNIAVTFEPYQEGSYRGVVHVHSDATAGSSELPIEGSATSIIVFITLQAQPAEGGSVSGSGSFIAGSTNEISAAPNSDWQFDQWSDGITDNPRVIVTGLEDIELSAEFSLIPTRIVELSGDLDFGPIKIGLSNTRFLTIANTGNSTLVITNIFYPDGFTGAWTGSIDSGAETNIAITFQPAVATNYAGMLRIQGNQTAGEFEFQVSGTGSIESVASYLVIREPVETPAFTTTLSSVRLAGRAYHEGGIDRVIAHNFRDVGPYDAAGNEDWLVEELPLFAGQNVIEVIALDAAGDTVARNDITINYTGDQDYEDLLRSGAVIQHLEFPDDLQPGDTVTVRWKVLSYVPVIARLDAGVPGGWHCFQNGELAGTDDSPWNVNGRNAMIYAFECAWRVPQKSGEFFAWFNIAQMDGYQYMIPVIPNGVDDNPASGRPKLIQRTILPGGNGSDPESDSPQFYQQRIFETSQQSLLRSSTTITRFELADDLVAGEEVTAEWTIQAYQPVDAEFNIGNVTSQVTWLSEPGVLTGDPVRSSYYVIDRLSGNRVYAKFYTFRRPFDVPNQPGEQQIYIRTRIAGTTNEMMFSTFNAGVDDLRAYEHDGLYGRFVERTIIER